MPSIEMEYIPHKAGQQLQQFSSCEFALHGPGQVIWQKEQVNK